VTISEAARKYVGMKEQPGNKFDDKTPLGAMLHGAGQKDGESWCCYFGEGCTVESFPWAEAQIRKEFSANSVQCFKNLVAAGHKVSAFPVPNSICFMQKYVDGVATTQGHTYVVVKNLPGANCPHETIEGNGSQQGSREGDLVANNTRPVQHPDTGLVTLGFIVPNYPKAA
jgi:hypothetical protein